MNTQCFKKVHTYACPCVYVYVYEMFCTTPYVAILKLNFDKLIRYYDQPVAEAGARARYERLNFLNIQERKF